MESLANKIEEKDVGKNAQATVENSRAIMQSVH